MKEIGMCFVPVLTQKNVFLLTKQYSLVIKVIVFSFFNSLNLQLTMLK